MYKVALAGVGVVGNAFRNIFQNKKHDLVNILGGDIEICGYLARSDKKLDIAYYNSYEKLISEAKPDILIELVGGTEMAYDMVKYALQNNVSVITANKALLATYGNELINIANKNKILLKYEAAVAGAIPIIRLLDQVFNFEDIDEVQAILNGTCNYILTKMTIDGYSYEKALDEAKKLGYAEADPLLDIDGTDSMQKLKIISSLVSKSDITSENIYYNGIQELNLDDIEFAKVTNSVIKLLAYAKYSENKAYIHLAPVIINHGNILADVNNNFNAVKIKSSYARETDIIGYGAGGYETASAVYADLQNVVLDNKNINSAKREIKYLEWLFENTKYYLRYKNESDLVKLQGYVPQIDIISVNKEKKYIVAIIQNSNILQELRSKFDGLLYLPILEH